MKSKQIFFFIAFISIFFCPILKAKPLTEQDNQYILAHIDKIKEKNAQLLQVTEDSQIDGLLKAKQIDLQNLLMRLSQVKGQHIVFVTPQQNRNFLNSRIKINAERGNDLAVKRDQVKVAEFDMNESLIRYLDYLILASNNYFSEQVVVDHSQQLLQKIQAEAQYFELPDEGVNHAIAQDLKENYRNFLLSYVTFQNILEFVLDHPSQIVSTAWFQNVSLLVAIQWVNDLPFASAINYKLAPFKVDLGGVVWSLIIFCMVYLCYPFVFKFTSWFIEHYVIEQGSEQQELIYLEIRKPARALLIFFALNLGMYAFFYKTDYRESLEGVSYVIYSLLFIWLLFKIVDSFVLVQVQKLSVSNKALRKELFNLGLQTGKAGISIIVLAFGLNHFGISLTAIMSTLGVGGLAFALAAKDTLTNLFGGMTILFDNVYRLGDWVEIGSVEGTVAEIGLRSTTIRTFDNALITIPNSLVSVSSVKNWNRRAVGRRIKMYVGVTYESNMDDLKQAIHEIRQMLTEHPGIANPKQQHGKKTKNFKFVSLEDTHGIKSTQLVFMDRYSDFSIDILIYCFSKTVNWADWLAVKEDVLFKIAAILKRNHLEFAYPTQVRIYRPEQRQQDSLPEAEFSGPAEP